MTENSTVQHLELPSKIESLSRIEILIDDICQTFKVNQDNYGNILIALTEAVNNAITHGNQLDPGKKVNLEYESTHTGLSFTIKDEGDGFDYKDIPDPTLPENIEKINGRGVFLMQSLADEVSFDNNGASVNLKFHLTNS